MAVLNDIDRYHFAIDAIERLSSIGPRAAYLVQELREKLVEHKAYIRKHGQDMPEVLSWRWSARS